MIHGRRVRQAREIRGLTQTEFARRVGVKQPAIAQIEAGKVQPTGSTLDAIALQTRFPTSFFEQEPLDNFPEGTLRFRARASMTSRQQAEGYWWGALLYEMVDRMGSRLRRPAARLPEVADGNVSSAAALARTAFGVSPDVPIRNLVLSAEKAGVVVVAIPFRLPGREAYSVWASESEVPVIVICNSTSGDRLRWSVAHELGHLILHRAVTTPLEHLEREADAFAGEFLLPAAGFAHEVSTPVTLAGLAPLKPRWGVSLQATIRHCYRLGLIAERQYWYLFEQMGSKGWRTREPDNLDVPIERPRTLSKMAEILYGNPVDARRMASDLRLVRSETAKEILDVHAKRPGATALKPSAPQAARRRVLPFGGKRGRA